MAETLRLNPTGMDDPALTIRQLAASLSERRLSVVDLVRTHLDKAKASQPGLNAFVAINEEQALIDANSRQSELERGLRRSLLHGIPFTVKDTIATKDMPTGMGTAFFSRYAPRIDAIPVAAHREAGAILIGKTTSSEFGLKSLTESPACGVTRNPVNPDLTVGGSSGGSAASIAVGVSSFSLVTDGGGSSRIPAACTGIYGLKTTYGTVASGNQVDTFTNQVATGLIARHPDDLRLGLEQLTRGHLDFPLSRLGEAVRDFRGPVLQEANIACARYLGFGDNHASADAAFDETVAFLKMQGAKVDVVDLDLRPFAQSFEVLMILAPLLRLSRLLRSNEDKVDPFILSLLAAAHDLTASDIAFAEADRPRIFAKIDEALRGRHGLLVPTLRHPPPPHDFYKKDHAIVRDLQTTWYANAFPFNMSGHPVVSFPTPVTFEKVPVSMQLVGPWYSDFGLLSLVEELALPHSINPVGLP
ncbi:amidase [Roseibium sp.]|uniref:amidase n=1 Tax=Roseibium sp. TaxID=1936156 RepID=UPI003BAE48AA